MDFLSTYKYITNKQHLQLDTYVPHFSLACPWIFHQKKGMVHLQYKQSQPQIFLFNWYRIMPGHQQFLKHSP